VQSQGLMRLLSPWTFYNIGPAADTPAAQNVSSCQMQTWGAVWQLTQSAVLHSCEPFCCEAHG
jgi:hypothetical protein